MKVLAITDYYLPHWTGISKSFSYILHSLSKENSVSVLTIRFDDNLPEKELIDTIDVKRLPYLFSFSRSKFSPLFFIACIPEIMHTDMVIINSPSAHIFPTSLLVKLFGKKLIILHQGDLILPEGVAQRLVEKIFDVATLVSFYLSDRLITFTKDYAEKSRVLKPFLSKCDFVIPALPVKKPLHSAVYSRLEKLKKNHSVLFGFAGRFVEEKGFDLLLSAIPKVLKKIPTAHFVYAGKTHMEYERFYENVRPLLSKIQPHLTELGLLDENGLADFYEGIDFIVVPSRSDCFPFVQAEAMFAGVPSLVSDIPGARYLVRETGFGIIFHPNDSDDLADTLIHAYRDQRSILKKYPEVLKILSPDKNERQLENSIKQ